MSVKKPKSTQKKSTSTKYNNGLDLDAGARGYGYGTYTPVIVMDGDGQAFEEMCCCLYLCHRTNPDTGAACCLGFGNALGALDAVSEDGFVELKFLKWIYDTDII
jgi:hypothetical protein